MQDILIGFLSKTLNMDTEGLAEILFKKSDDGKVTEELNEGALSQLLALDAERVQKLKPNTKEIFDNGFKKAQSEVSEQWEKNLRKNFNVDAENALQGDKLIEAIKAAMASEGIKPDKIKTSQEYMQLERQMREALEAQKSEFEGTINDLKTRYSKEQTWASVSGSIRAALTELNPVLPHDQSKADRVISMFLNEFREYDFQADENGSFIPMKDGKRVENQQGYAKPLSELVRERAEMLFDFQEKQAGNAGNQNQPTGRRVNVRFKDENDYLEQYTQAADFEAKEALHQAWTAQQSN